MDPTPLHSMARSGRPSSDRTAAPRPRRPRPTLSTAARTESRSSGPVGAAQRAAMANGLGFDRILVPLDFSESSVAALRFALPLARATGARLDLLHVLEPVQAALGPRAATRELPRTRATQRQRSALARLKRLAAVEVRRPLRANTLVREGAAARAIIATAAELRSNLLVLSTRGHTGLQRFLLGSTAEAVVHRAPCPVLTVRRPVQARQGTPPSPPSSRLRRVLVATDFSAASRVMLRFAVAFATQFGASLRLLHVVDRLNVPSRMIAYATQLQRTVLHDAMAELADWAKRLVPPDVPTIQIVRAGEPYDVIRTVARTQRADLIILATRGHSALKRFFLGTTAGRVVRHAACPVLVVR